MPGIDTNYRLIVLPTVCGLVYFLKTQQAGRGIKPYCNNYLFIIKTCIMALTKQELLSKYIKLTELNIAEIVDESSENTEVIRLVLARPIVATGSIPTAEGKKMQLETNEIFIAADDIEKFTADVEETDNGLVYKGKMKLDVSKPNGSMRNGQFQVTKPAKAWLTGVAFNKRGGNMNNERQTSLQNVISDMFGKGTFKFGVEYTPEQAAEAQATAGAREQKPDLIDTGKTI